MAPRLKLSVLDESFSICRLDAGSALPAGILDLDFFSITRTQDEVSIVAPGDELKRLELPAGAVLEGGWSCLKVEGPLEFSLVGVLAALSGTLAEAGISLFALSTYDTDYLLVGKRDLDSAIAALSEAGHSFASGS